MTFNYREDGRVERTCKHGIGHTVKIPKKYIGTKDEWAWWVHGCCGCCKEWKNDKRKH